VCSPGGHAFGSSFGFSGRDRVVDLELPLPKVFPNLHEGKFYTPAVHGFVGGASFATSSANNFKSTWRVRSSVVSASCLL
jgi:hypothetical protein